MAPAALLALLLPCAAALAENLPADLKAMVARHARANGVPIELAHAVIMVESRYNPQAQGAGGALGLMQIKHTTAVGLGYRGPPEGLLDPETNLTYGMRYLAGAHRRAGGDVCGTVMRYSGGWGATTMNAGQVVYCGRAKGFMASAAAYGIGRSAKPERPIELVSVTGPDGRRRIAPGQPAIQAAVLFPPNLVPPRAPLPESALAFAAADEEPDDLPMVPARRVALGYWPAVEESQSLAVTFARKDEEPDSADPAERVASGHAVFDAPPDPFVSTAEP